MSVETEDEDRRLAGLLSLWQQARAEGQSVEPAHLCRHCPHLLPSLQQRIAALEGMEAITDTAGQTVPLDPAAPSSTSATDPFATRPPAPGELPTLAPGMASDRPARARSGPVIPGYEVLDLLGRGGMGVVYRARQARLGRIVALKMILDGEHARADDLGRFRTEAEALARLQHPHIVQIFEIGEYNGRPFFSLELCAGGSLSTRLNGTPLPQKEAAALVEKLARAVQAAHQKGVIHRDLKPANVLLTEDGTLKITDFGLAKMVQVGSGQTHTGAIMGTPSYMAPEQARGQSRSVGPSADVYALGALLYECLTGRPPFRAETSLETVLQVLEREPAPPRLLNPKMDRDLEAICLKCLEKEPAQRYPSAAALADDLGRFLRDESVQVASVNVLDRVSRALGHSHLEADVHAWSSLLLAWAGVVFLTHLVIFALGCLGSWPPIVTFPAYLVQFLLMGLAYAYWKPAQASFATRTAQELRALWLPYILVCQLVPAVAAQLQGFQDQRLAYGTYAYTCLLTALPFFFLGSRYWGRCHAMGLAFLALAVLSPSWLEGAPLGFGLVWTASLASIGLHLRRLSREASPAPMASQQIP